MRLREASQLPTTIGSSPSSRVTPQSQVMVLEGEFTVSTNRFQSEKLFKTWSEPRLVGDGGSLGCTDRTTLFFSATGTTSLRKYSMFFQVSSYFVGGPSAGSGGRSFMRS